MGHYKETALDGHTTLLVLDVETAVMFQTDEHGETRETVLCKESMDLSALAVWLAR